MKGFVFSRIQSKLQWSSIGGIGMTLLNRFREEETMREDPCGRS